MIIEELAFYLALEAHIFVPGTEMSFDLYPLDAAPVLPETSHHHLGAR